MADGRALVRAGFRALLERLPGVEVVGETGDGLEAVELVRFAMEKNLIGRPAARAPWDAGA